MARVSLAAAVLTLLLVAPGAANDWPLNGPLGRGAHVRMRLLEIPAPAAADAAIRTHWCDAFGVKEPGRGRFVVRLADDKARRIAVEADRGDTPLRMETRTWVLNDQPAILYDAYEEAYV